MRALYGVARQRVHGDVNLTGEAYGSVGQPGRRPGSSWRAQVSPRIDLGFGISATADALFSSEGTQLRQNINQAGFNPEWSWGKLYLGDFSRPLTQYTVQGVRSRGAGLDLRFGGWQANVQTGRTQRAVSRPGDQLVFERRLSAGNLEWRHGSGLGVGVSVAHAKDNPNSVERNLLIADSLALDSLVADTLLDPFRPRPQASTRPQENLVGGLALELPLFRQTLRLKGEVAGALLSSDITRPRIADGAGGALDVLDPLMPLRLSTHGDVAWNGEVAAGATHGGQRPRPEDVHHRTRQLRRGDQRAAGRVGESLGQRALQSRRQRCPGRQSPAGRADAVAQHRRRSHPWRLRPQGDDDPRMDVPAHR